MKQRKQIFAIMLCVVMCLSCVGCAKEETSTGSKKGFNVVASFYPMHILTMNLTTGIEDVGEMSMADPNIGCIHDHTFSADDMKKVENADVFVENGLELETFNDKIKKAFPDMKVVEAAANVTDYVKDGDEINGHVWTNIDDYIKQVQYVSEQLQNYNPKNKEKYAENEKAYLKKLTDLKSEYANSIAELEGKKVLVLDETLPSLCVYAKLQSMEIETDHEQESLSADDIKNTISKMKQDGVKSIFISQNSDRKNAETIAAETGATIYELNSCMVGDVNEDAYITDMKENFEILSSIK